MTLNKKPISIEKARLKIASLCSKSEQSEYDLKGKLFKMGLSASQSKEIIDFLKEEKYLDNRRYAKSFANDKAKFSYWGPYKIKLALSQHKIPGNIISEVISEIDPLIWKEAILKCAINKARNLDLIDEETGFENRKKLFKHLISRGFSSIDANKAVKKMKFQQVSDNEKAD